MAPQAPLRAVINAGVNPNTKQAPVDIILTHPDGTAVSSVKKQAAQVDSTATDVAGLKTDFNALLAKLRLAGVIS